MNVVSRALAGAKSVVTNPTERRLYLARLSWLAGGSAAPAWSLEYRRGLTGRFSPKVERFQEQGEEVRHCPGDCEANAPLSHLYEQRYTYQISNTVVNSTSGAPIMRGTSGSPFFVRESISWPFESIVSHGLDIPEQRQVGLNLTQLTFVFPSTANYYHWLVEELPLLLRTRELPGDVLVAVSANSVTEKHYFVAEQLGISLKLVPQVISLSQQIMPGRASDSWFIHPGDQTALFAFGRIATKNFSPSESTKIYVSRKNSKRALAGEDQLEDLLRSEGFFIAHLESMAWRDQISLFQGAEVVVGPHGAGLANLVFTNPKALVIELINGYHYNRCFEWICHMAGHSYKKIDVDSDNADLLPNQLAQQILTYLK